MTGSALDIYLNQFFSALGSPLLWQEDIPSEPSPLHHQVDVQFTFSIRNS